MRVAATNAIKVFAILFLPVAIWMAGATIAKSSSDATADGVTVRCCAFKKTTFLSTESATAVLEVTNHSNAPVRLETGNISFSRRQGGEPQQSRYCNRDCWRIFRQIDPGTTKFTEITLPKCAVLSDPCTLDIVVDYDITEGDVKKAYSAQLPEYRFVADPTATFDIAGLRGNLPVIVTQGLATENVVPDSILITITTKSASPEFTSELRNHGLTPGGPVLTRFGSSSTIHSSTEPSQLSQLIAALQTVQQRFKDEIVSMVWQPRIPNQSNASSVSGSAGADADRQAQDLAITSHIARGSDWSFASDVVAETFAVANPGGTPSQIDFNSGYADPLPVYFVPTFSPVTVVSIMQQRYIGVGPANFDKPAALERLAAAAFRPTGYVPPLHPAVTISADRPELYAIASASKEAALHQGVAVELAALLAAQRSIFRVAMLLGVRPEICSLLVGYPSNDRDLQSVGIGMTFSGGERQRWTRIMPDPGVRTHRSAEPKISSMVPIAVRDEATTITETATSSPLWAPKLLRLGMEIDSQAAMHVAPQVVLARLREDAGVADVAVTTRDQGQRVRYEVLLKSKNRNLVPGLIDGIKSSYASITSSEASFSLDPYEPNCAKVTERLIRAALREGWLSALADARRKGVRLRKLLLVAPSPFEDKICAPLAQPIGTDALEYNRADQLPTYFGPVPMFEGATMVFRTFPAAGALH